MKEENEENKESKNLTLKVFEMVEKFGLWILEKLHLKFLAKFYTDHLEGMRYLVCGALSTVVNIASYALVAYTIFAGIQPETLRVTISDCVAFVIALIFAYWVNKTVVFETKCENFKSLLKEITSFTVSTGFSAGSNKIACFPSTLVASNLFIQPISLKQLKDLINISLGIL